MILTLRHVLSRFRQVFDALPLVLRLPRRDVCLRRARPRRDLRAHRGDVRHNVRCRRTRARSRGRVSQCSGLAGTCVTMFGSRGDVCHDVRVSQGRVCLAQTHTARRLASGAHGGRAARHSATSPTGRRPVKEDCVRLAPARPQVYAFLRDHAAGRARVGRAARVPVDTHRVRQLLCLRGVWPLRLSGEGGGGLRMRPIVIDVVRLGIYLCIYTPLWSPRAQRYAKSLEARRLAVVPSFVW